MGLKSMVHVEKSMHKNSMGDVKAVKSVSHFTGIKDGDHG